MAPRHPCRNCGCLRSGHYASCLARHYQQHKNQLDDRRGLSQLEHPPIQLHIRTLIAVTTSAAFVCALSKNWGLDVLWLAIRNLAFFSCNRVLLLILDKPSGIKNECYLGV
jgi:hypothetical protein